MLTKNSRTEQQTLSSSLAEAYEDFVLSRQAAGARPATLNFYKFTAAKFITWLEAHGVKTPAELTPAIVRQYLAELAQCASDNTAYVRARAIRTVLIFWNNEGYTAQRVKFPMPKTDKKRQLVLDADQVTRLLAACEYKRDRALLALMVDSGIRREEATALNWGDVDFSSGIVHVKRGKGGKARTAVIGPTARRYLLAYRRERGTPALTEPVFVSRTRQRLSGNAVRLIFHRLSEKTGIRVTPHSLRRTFAVLCIRAGMGVFHLQNLMGHETLEMTRKYVQLVESDLLESHKASSPLDNLARLARGGDKDT